MRNRIPDGFNWFTVLDDLRNGGDITPDRFHELNDMAGKWPTCACGQLCTLLPRNSEGCPEDQELRTLGGGFANQVSRRQWCLALETFGKIEARTTELLEQMALSHS